MMMLVTAQPKTMQSNGESILQEPHRVPRPVRRVLFAIDQLRQWGGAERMLFETVKRIDPARFAASIVTFDLDRELPGLDQMPVPIHFIPLRKTYHWHALKAAAQLRRMVRSEGVHVFHSFFETSDLWASPIAKMSGCPVIISSRRDMGILRTPKHILAYPLANRVFDKVLTVSDQVKSRTIEQENIRPAKIETLYNGVDLDSIDLQARSYGARHRFSIAPHALLITALANVRAVKGLDVLARAAAIVVPHFPEVRFAIAGKMLEVDTLRKLHSLIADLRLEENFIFLGALENPYPLLAESDAFVLPSRNEGFSNALIEAMACGLPCVATRVGGNAEALADGVNGFLVESEDHAALADRLLTLLRDPGAGRRMGRLAREVIQRRFAITAVVNRLMNIYDEVLDSHYA